MRTDYPANRGPLDGVEHVRRRPDPFSVAGGCIGIIIGCLFVAALLGALFVACASAIVGAM